jgi:hypothetical protein
MTETKTLKIAEPCSPELRACVDDLISQGKDEASAWAICKSQLGESALPDLKALAKLMENASEPFKSAFKKFLEPLDRIAVEWASKGKQLQDHKVLIETFDKAKQELQEIAARKDVEIGKLNAEVSKRDGLVEANRKLQIDNDNIRDKVKAQMKGTFPNVVKQPEPCVGDPLA